MAFIQRISLLIFCFLISTSFAIAAKFGGAEHIFIGDQVKIYFPGDYNIPRYFPNYVFHLPSGLAASYGDILSLGDFYELVDQPIYQAPSLAERKARFLASFNSFALNPEGAKEAAQILGVLHDEQNKINEAIKRGENPSNVLKAMGNEVGRKLNCITGGGCTQTWWLQPGRYLLLAESDYDHFGDEALIAYEAGHEAAIEAAAKAGKAGDIKRLELAFAMNAFASHFLSDRFASGHLRVPRTALPAKITPSVTGSILSSFMHAEENTYGLHVHNKRGDHWVTYGDRLYFEPANRFGREVQILALQRSFDNILSAYGQGYLLEDVNELIPQPDEVRNEARNDISVLFYVNPSNGDLMRRKDIANVYDKRWTNDWWGWSTLAALTKQYGLPPEVQAKLARSEFGAKAIAEGLITDKTVLASLKRSL